MNLMNKIYSLYLRILEWICIALLIIILACMLFQIICRIFVISQSFTEELARICFCVMAFMGSPLALAEGIHIAVDMVVRRFSNTGKRIFGVLDAVLIDVFSVFGIIGLQTMMKANTKTTAVSISWIMMNWIYGLVYLSLFFLFFVSTVQLILILKGKSEITLINMKEMELERNSEQSSLAQAIESELGEKK
ncbi:TRAP transporter small permease subunit [Treponema parvum]|uniref:TRAP transporter small permease subunit n=1 Tax=Treponema parvum TaxID=138851 RepID=A0A975IET3_9SPIR|nr:TRAP transporter small permease subunit [Treponema parvum]QTQ13604.1 TRAP transporter small permease subunit [Treponema parvum]